MDFLKTASRIVVALTISISAAQASPEISHEKRNLQELQKTLKHRQAVSKHYDKLQKKIALEGKVRVIVKVAPVGVSENSKGSFKPGLDKVTQFSKAIDADVVRAVDRFGFVAIEVNAAQLDRLLDSGIVESVEEDRLLKPSLAQSVPWVGGDALWSLGYNGQNHAVAILDTGFELNHPFLANRIVEEACFSSNGDVSISLCPNGQDQMFGVGSAADCSQLYGGGCSHGTHVAGIAAGNNGSLFGVAPGAELVVINVFHYNTGVNDVRAWGSDILAGLNWILHHANTPNIVAANMSIGGGLYTEPCDNDTTATTIAALRQANIATVISSGNDGSHVGVSWPSCISEAITVGSTFKDFDSFSGFSNTSPQVDLLAPGSSIYSSLPNGSYGFSWGTSMAAPHVTGAFATLRNAFPSATVNEIEAALKSTGAPLWHNVSGIHFPRIDLFAAYVSLSAGGSPLNIYEAEEQTWFRAKVESEHPGYTGSGYVNTDNVIGSWIEFAVVAEEAGDYNITLRYANGGNDNRSTDVLVNGSTVLTAHPYSPTGAWWNWADSSFTVTLTAGQNAIRLLSVTSGGAPNLDYMEVTAIESGNSAPIVINPIADMHYYETRSNIMTWIGNVFSDSDGDELSYSVSIDDASVASVAITGGSSNPHLSLTNLGVGTAVVTISASDNVATTSTQFTLSISPNQHPYVINSIQDYTLAVGDPSFSIDLTAVFFDPDGDSLTYNYEKSDDENANVSMPNATSLLVNPQMDGPLTVYVSAEDGKGGHASLSFSVIVLSESIELNDIIEAEHANWSAGPVENEHAGFYGAGYVNTPNIPGQWLSFTTTIPSAGTYTVGVRYANGTSVNRNASIAVNGNTVIPSVSFPGTGAWANWAEATFDVQLSPGNHEIRLNILSSLGAANIDRYTIMNATP